MATAVDGELKSTISVLESLGVSDDLVGSRLAQFHHLARQVARQRGWRNILLADASGRIILSSISALGEEFRREPVLRGYCTSKFTAAISLAIPTFSMCQWSCLVSEGERRPPATG